MKQYRMDCTHQRPVVIFPLRLRQIDNIDRLLPLNMTLRPWIPYEWKYDYKFCVSSLFWAIKFDIIIDNNDNTKKLMKRKSLSQEQNVFNLEFKEYAKEFWGEVHSRI